MFVLPQTAAPCFYCSILESVAISCWNQQNRPANPTTLQYVCGQPASARPHIENNQVEPADAEPLDPCAASPHHHRHTSPRGTRENHKIRHPEDITASAELNYQPCAILLRRTAAPLPPRHTRHKPCKRCFRRHAAAA